MRIDVVFDTVCPWCYVGMRRLRKALRARPFIKARLHWQPFLLNPELPQQGMDRQQFLERKFGHPMRVQRALTAVIEAGAAEGIDFRFDQIARMPNSQMSHRLLTLAAEEGCDWEVLEALFSAFFTEGRDIGDQTVLTEIGRELGIPRGKLTEAFDLEEGPESSLRGNMRAHKLGVNSVPCFIFEQRFAVSGAQDSEVLLKMMDLAREILPEALAI